MLPPPPQSRVHLETPCGRGWAGWAAARRSRSGSGTVPPSPRPAKSILPNETAVPSNSPPSGASPALPHMQGRWGQHLSLSLGRAPRQGGHPALPLPAQGHTADSSPLWWPRNGPASLFPQAAPPGCRDKEKTALCPCSGNALFCCPSVCRLIPGLERTGSSGKGP